MIIPGLWEFSCRRSPVFLSPFSYSRFRYSIFNFRISLQEQELAKMPSQAPVGTFLMLAGSGVATHLAIFIPGEWHMQAPLLFKLYALTYLGSFAMQRCYCTSFYEAFIITNTFRLSYIVGLFASICVYRKHFHQCDTSFRSTFIWSGVSRLGVLWERRDIPLSSLPFGFYTIPSSKTSLAQ
jgi:hypothetical protein